MKNAPLLIICLTLVSACSPSGTDTRYAELLVYEGHYE